MMRLLGLSPAEIAAYRRCRPSIASRLPGAVRACPELKTAPGDIDRFLAALAEIATNRSSPFAYRQDPTTSDDWPEATRPARPAPSGRGASCARG
jgi:hypothetical protein